MAEAIVSGAIQRASDFLIAEVSFVYGVRQEVERLQSELKRMRSFLRDMDNKQDQDERVRNWVSEIRSVAYDAEDILDEFRITVSRSDVAVCSNFRNTVSMFTKCCRLHETGTKIISLQSKLVDIANSMQLYGIRIRGDGEGSVATKEMQKQLRRPYPYEEEEDLISLENCTRDLIAQLMRREDRVRVVSIVGMGGLGKTTLAKKIYNLTEVKKHFDSVSWAFLSQEFSPKSILFGILKDVAPQEIRHAKIKGEEELTSRLYKALKDRLYLVVLDDMWTNESWDSLKHAFPNGKAGSKILLTTRSKEIALYADPWIASTEMPFLSDEESWTLLRNKAFPKDIFGKNYCIVRELEELGKEMARKCGGLPLAIVAVGGLLATKKSPKEWEEVHQNMTMQLIKLDRKQQYSGVYRILALSYHDLPWYLKPCFLYFSTFPKGTEIFKKSLIRMWIAEGILSQPLIADGTANETLENVGEQYIQELINRCMIQETFEENRIDGWLWRGAKICRLHDLMRDVCVSKAREQNFLMVVDDHGGIGEEATDISSLTPRRISIHCTSQGPQHYLSMIKGEAHLRALSYVPQLPKDSYVLRGQDLRFISEKFRLLRVLNIGVATSVTSVPRAIGNLIHLRYLRWRMKGSLPASIGNLRSLLILDLRSSEGLCLPDVLRKLQLLRHLLVDAPQAVGCRVDTLKNLETLRWVRAEFLLKEEAVLKLVNVRHLGITFKKADEVEAILRSPIFDHIRSLGMEMTPECPFPTIEPISRCHRMYKIFLKGKISEDVDSSHHIQLSFLPATLSKITLCLSELKRDPLPILEKLPGLSSLRLLEKVYRGSEMVCSANGFPKLEFLEFEGLQELQEWSVEKGAFPYLKTMVISDLDKLAMIPGGMKFVTTLQVLDLRLMRGEFKERVKRTDEMEGEDFQKVQHVPQVKL